MATPCTPVTHGATPHRATGRFVPPPPLVTPKALAASR